MNIKFMTNQDFIKQFSEKLQISKTDLTEETRLDSLDEWDSWNKLTLMTFLDESFSVNLSSNDLKEFVTIGDIIRWLGEKISN